MTWGAMPGSAGGLQLDDERPVIAVGRGHGSQHDRAGRVPVRGRHDAASETGNGSVGTWSTAMPALLGAPIDHVMASSDWHATGSIVLRSMATSDSDHRPLIVQLEPAG